MLSNNERLYIRAVLNNEKISTVVHAKDVNRNGVLSFNCFSYVCPDIPRADLLTVTVLSVGVRFGTPYAPVQCCGSGESTN